MKIDTKYFGEILRKLLTERRKADILIFVRRTGGIGRRARFRSVW